MSKIVGNKRKKIKEQILQVLETKTLWTNQVAAEIGRDEEFTKKILLELKEEKKVAEIDENAQGKKLKQRRKWKIIKEISQEGLGNQ